MKMRIWDNEKKQMISDLQTISDKRELINLMRKYLKSEYKEVFDKEREEEEKTAPGDDISIYTYRKLVNYITSEYKINICFDELKNIKTH